MRAHGLLVTHSRVAWRRQLRREAADITLHPTMDAQQVRCARPLSAPARTHLAIGHRAPAAGCETSAFRAIHEYVV
jgi:hypothetical protein